MTTIYIKDSAALPKRADFDFYPTPLTFCRTALAQLPPTFSPRTILDPGAGTGVWGRAARERWRKSLIVGVELREVVRPAAYNFWYTADFLRMPAAGPCFHLVMSNPPFKRAESFVRASLALLEPAGYALYLLRLNFLESAERYRGLWREHPPKAVIVSAKRVSFTGDGQSNATAYAIYLWQKGYTGETSLRWMIDEGGTAAKVDRQQAPIRRETQIPMFAAEAATP